MSPSSLRLLSLGPGGPGVGRIGGGTFSPPRGSGGRKTPTPSFSRRISPDRGRWGSSEEKPQDVQRPSFEHTQRSKEGAKNDAPPNEHRRPSGRRLGRASGAACFTRRLGKASYRRPVRDSGAAVSNRRTGGAVSSRPVGGAVSNRPVVGKEKRHPPLHLAMGAAALRRPDSRPTMKRGVGMSTPSHPYRPRYRNQVPGDRVWTRINAIAADALWRNPGSQNLWLKP